jgi:hypothetical protein
VRRYPHVSALFNEVAGVIPFVAAHCDPPSSNLGLCRGRWRIGGSYLSIFSSAVDLVSEDFFSKLKYRQPNPAPHGARRSTLTRKITPACSTTRLSRVTAQPGVVPQRRPVWLRSDRRIHRGLGRGFAVGLLDLGSRGVAARLGCGSVRQLQLQVD